MINFRPNEVLTRKMAGLLAGYELCFRNRREAVFGICDIMQVCGSHNLVIGHYQSFKHAIFTMTSTHDLFRRVSPGDYWLTDYGIAYSEMVLGFVVSVYRRHVEGLKTSMLRKLHDFGSLKMPSQELPFRLPSSGFIPDGIFTRRLITMLLVVELLVKHEYNEAIPILEIKRLYDGYGFRPLASCDNVAGLAVLELSTRNMFLQVDRNNCVWPTPLGFSNLGNIFGFMLGIVANIERIQAECPKHHTETC